MGPKSSKTCLRTSGDIVGCLETILACLGVPKMKVFKNVKNRHFEHEIQCLEWNCLSVFLMFRVVILILEGMEVAE